MLFLNVTYCGSYISCAVHVQETNRAMSIDLDVLALSFVVLPVCTHSVSTVHPLDVCLSVHVVPRGEAGPTQCRN